MFTKIFLNNFLLTDFRFIFLINNISMVKFFYFRFETDIDGPMLSFKLSWTAVELVENGRDNEFNSR